MQPNLILDLELVWNLMMVMLLLLISIVLLENVMDILVDVMDSFNKYGGLINLSVSMGRFLLC